MLLRKSTATFLAGAAVLGGAVGGGAVVAVANGGGSTTTTITAPAPAAATASTVATAGNAGAVYRRASQSVVQITAVSTGGGSGGGGDGANPFAPGGGQGSSGGEATGTGFAIDSKGLIVTNEHVVDGAGKLTVTLQDGTDLKATLVGKDASTDLALLRVDPGSHSLPALTLSDDSGLTIGQDVYAIGSPYALQGTLTTGVISQLHRQITSPNGFSISDAIQTDAELNPGNSGGPLLDASGQVIGVNAQVYGGSQSASGQATGGTGLGFAIPSSTVKRVVSQLSEGGTIQHAYLGVGIADGTGTTGGAKLGSVLAGGPAGKAGLKAGDVITKIAATKISERGRPRGRDLLAVAGRQGRRDVHARRLDADGAGHARHPAGAGDELRFRGRGSGSRPDGRFNGGMRLHRPPRSFLAGLAALAVAAAGAGVVSSGTPADAHTAVRIAPVPSPLPVPPVLEMAAQRLEREQAAATRSRAAPRVPGPRRPPRRPSTRRDCRAASRPAPTRSS